MFPEIPMCVVFADAPTVRARRPPPDRIGRPVQ
jgi:hypothetical protein